MDYFDKRQSKESDLHFDKAIELCPDSTMYLVLSSINKNFLEDDSTAIINLTNYLNRNPNNTDVLTTRAESYLLEEKYEDCLKDVNKSIELGSTREKNFMIKGDALESLGRYENAIEAYDKYISTFPKEDNSKDKTEAIKRRDICKEKVKHKKN